MPLIAICLAKLMPSGYTIVTSTLFDDINDSQSNRTYLSTRYDLDNDWSLLSSSRRQLIPYTLSNVRDDKDKGDKERILRLLQKHFGLFGQLVLVNASASSNAHENEKALNEYVYEERQTRGVDALLYNYYVGISLSFNNNNSLNACLFYNTMSFHSGASVLHRFDNFLLEFYSPTIRRTDAINSNVVVNNKTSSLTRRLVINEFKIRVRVRDLTQEYIIAISAGLSIQEEPGTR